jgi:hypothetical protein
VPRHVRKRPSEQTHENSKIVVVGGAAVFGNKVNVSLIRIRGA